MGMAHNVWTTATRPVTNLVPGLLGFNTTTGGYEFWNGVAWTSMGGASCLDAVIATDPGPMVALAPAPGAMIPLGGGGGDANSNPATFGIGTVVPGAVTIVPDGWYEIRAEVQVMDGGAAPYAVQAFIQTTPSGLGAWLNLPQADAYGEIATPGGMVTLATMRGLVQVVGGGGLDVQVVGQTNVGGPPFANTLGTDTRLSILRVC